MRHAQDGVLLRYGLPVAAGSMIGRLGPGVAELDGRHSPVFPQEPVDAPVCGTWSSRHRPAHS